MKELKFKTNIRCEGCVTTVSKVLDTHEKIDKWSVDLSHDDRLLSVHTENLIIDELKEALKGVNYQAEEM